MLPKAARKVTLIGKPRGKRNFRERHIRIRQQLYGALNPAAASDSQCLRIN
jgi:hypothetical protein